MTGETGTVYALIDPRFDAVRYIGATTKTLARRLAGHRSSPLASVEPWLLQLKALGLSPEIRPIVTDVPLSRLAATEQEQIDAHFDAGWPLLNAAARPNPHFLTVRVAQRRLEKARLIGGDVLERAQSDLEAAIELDRQREIREAKLAAHLRWLFPEDPLRQPDAIMRHLRAEGNEHLLPQESWEQLCAVMVDVAATLKSHGYTFQDVLYSSILEGVYHLVRHKRERDAA